MKTTTANFLTAQLADVIEQDYRVELLDQWTGAITDRDSSTQIKVSGDATSFFSNGDTFLIPCDDFETEHIITTAPSYSGGKTTLICSGSSFGTDIVGLDVAKKIDITSYILDQGISPIRISTEGITLNSYLADDVKLSLDNEDGYFYDADGNGLFNSGRIFWVKIIFKLTNDSTEFLVFGGLDYTPDIRPITDYEAIEVLCTGHLKELERYPGWYLAEDLGYLPNITGVDLIQVTEPENGTFEGIRKLEYIFPDGRGIKGLTVNSVSDDTPVGFHILKYHPPSSFQYDYGAWTSLSAGASDQTLTSDKGHTVNIDTPSNFDLRALEEFIYVENAISPEISDVGKASLKFDNGVKKQLESDFEIVFFNDYSGTSFDDITRGFCSHDMFVETFMNAIYDGVLILSSKPFNGISVQLLASNLVAGITVLYSKHFNTWGTLSVNDGTSNFTQDGDVTWDIPGDWRKTDYSIGGTEYPEYYCIWIYLTSYTSGSVTLKRVLRYMRLFGQDNIALDIVAKFEHLPIKSCSDDIILKNDSSDILQPCVWRQNMAFEGYLKLLLDEANYTASYRTLDDLKLTDTNPFIGLYGRPPRANYSKHVTAICVDTTTSPETVYLGIEDELWKVTETGSFEYIDTLDIYHKPSGTGSGDEKWIKVLIRRLVMDSSGYLHGIAWAEFVDEPEYANDPENYRRPCIVFRSTSLTAITEQNQVDVSNLSVFIPGTQVFRMGYYHTTDKNEIGQHTGGSIYCGENITIPFRQIVAIENGYDPAYISFYDKIGLTDGGSSNYPRHFNDQELYYLEAGWYFGSDSHIPGGDAGDLGFHWSFGQKGFVVWSKALDAWWFLEWTGSAWQLSIIEYDGTITNKQNLSNYQNQILCGCANGPTNSKMFLGLMIMDEAGGTFPGDLCDCYIKSIWVDGTNYITLFDFSSDSVESNQSLSSGDEKYCTLLDMVYNENDDTLVGCLFDRENFEYHVYVYDISNDKLYTSQTGTGFTFQTTFQVKEFIYNSNDDKVYAVVTDMRYHEENTYLISIEFTAPGGSPDGTEITLTFESKIAYNEIDVIAMTMGGSGRIYGITEKFNYLFQYDDEIYPRFFLANTKDDSFRQNLSELAEAMNMIHSINPDRTIVFSERDTNRGSMTIEHNCHYQRDTMQPLKNWAHKYDGVEVFWENPLTGESGSEKAGTFGWQRRILPIKNYFIQYPQLAKLIADKYNDFFGSYRKEIDFMTFLIYQIENRDKFTFNHSGEFDFSASIEWMITELILDYWNCNLQIKGLELL